MSHQIDISPLGTMQHRNYERHVFFYVLIMSILLQIACFSFRQFSSFSNGISVLLNFGIFLLFAIAIILTPNFYQKYIRKSVGDDPYSESILIYNFQFEREREEPYLRANGFLPPNQLETNAIRVVFCIMLFEMFFVHGWLDKDLNFLWKPDWIQSVINWMIGHAENNDPKYHSYWFAIDLKGDLAEKYNNETFLSSPLGQATMLLHSWRILTYYICFFCVGIVMWKPLDWLGMERVNPRNINGIISFLIASICTFFMNIMLALILTPIFFPMGEPIGAALTFLHPIKATIGHVGLYLFVMVLGLFSLKLYTGWFSFWKRVYLKFRS